MLEQIVNHIRCGIFVLSIEPANDFVVFRFLIVNPHFVEMLRSLDASQSVAVSLENFIDKTIQECLPTNIAEAIATHAQLCLQKQEAIRYEQNIEPESRDSGQERIITIDLVPCFSSANSANSANQDLDSQTQYIIGSCWDSTREKQLEEEYLINKATIHHLFNDISDGLIVVDREGIVRSVNQSAENLFNRQASELVGELFGLPVVSGERTDVDIIRKGGEMIAAEMRVMPSHQSIDEIAYIVASLRDITERKKAQDALWLRERAIAASSNGIVINDVLQPDQPIIYVNPAFERITGYVASEVIGQNCRFLQGHERNQPALLELRQAILNEQECHVVLSNYRKDGTQFWNELFISPVFDDQGKLTNFIGIQTDITARIKAEEKLRESEERLRTVLAAVKKGITFSNKGGYFEVFNPGMEDLTGYSMAEANACDDFTWLLYRDPDERYRALQGLQRLEQLGTTYEIETVINTKNGDKKNVLISSSLLSYKGQQMYLSTYDDITARKQAEEQMRHQREKERLLSGITLKIQRSLNIEEILSTTVAEARQLLQSDRVVIYKFDPDWNGRFIVEAADIRWESVLGASVLDHCFMEKYVSLYQRGRINVIDDVFDLKVAPCHRDLLVQFQVMANLVVPIIYSEKLWGLLIAHQCSATRPWKQFEIDLLQQLANHVAIAIQQAELFQQVQALNADLLTLNADLEGQVTERTMQLQQALAAEKELGELKSRFVSMASHEFRTPLATIQASSDLLKHYGHKMSDDKKMERINKIQVEVKNMTDLLEDVLVIGKVEAGKLELHPDTVDMEKFCREIIEETDFLSSEKHKISFSHGGNCENIVIDAKLLRQVIANLLSNAIKYSTQGGAVIFDLECNLDLIRFSIKDRGIGIPRSDMEKIFDAFYRAQNVGNISGTGLGLAIARAAVELHGGTMIVESEVNVGTTITVTIPNNMTGG